MKKYTIPAVILGAILVIGGWVTSTYNNFIELDMGTQKTWAEVENSYQSRFDLATSLFQTVSGIANLEKSTFIGVTEARNQWQNASNRSEQMEVANQFESALSRLLVTVEAYPTITSGQNFLELQASLEGIENRLRVARRDFNEAVGDYNQTVRTVPSNFVALIFGFQLEDFFEANPEDKQRPDLEFTFD